MTELPPEIIADIVQRILDDPESGDCHNLLVVSRFFQDIVEKRNFHSLRIYSDRDLGHFAQYLSRWGRASHLRHLDYCLVPHLSLTDPSGWTQQELDDLSRSATSDISGIFYAINTLENLSDPNSRLISLFLEIRTLPALRWSLWHTWRAKLLLTGSNPLPRLDCITGLRIGDGPTDEYAHDELERGRYPEYLDPAVIPQLLPYLPNLQRLQARYLHDDSSSDYYRGGKKDSHVVFAVAFGGPRRDSRHDFAHLVSRAVEARALPSGLASLELRFGHPIAGRPADHDASLPDLNRPFPYDPLSNSIRLLSGLFENLRSLKLSGTFDWTLFVPPDEDATAVRWPNLETFSVVFYLESPAGRWYFEGGGGQGADKAPLVVNDYPTPNSSFPSPLAEGIGDPPFSRFIRRSGSSMRTMQGHFHYRRWPSRATIEPFLEAWAKAMAQMPKLERASLWCPLRVVIEDHTFSMSSSHETHDSAWGISWQDVEEEPVTRVTWYTEGWRPGSPVLSQLRRAWQRNGKTLQTLHMDGLPELVSGPEREVLWPDDEPLCLYSDWG